MDLLCWLCSGQTMVCKGRLNGTSCASVFGYVISTMSCLILAFAIPDAHPRSVQLQHRLRKLHHHNTTRYDEMT